MTMNRRCWSLVLMLLLLILACIPLSGIASPQLNEMLKVTLTVYALARGLNALISVVQGTELAIEPMGVGVTLTPGQVLDPLNDLIEQVSFVLLMASASIGIQKILLSAGDVELFRGLIIGLILITTIVLWLGRSNQRLQTNMLRCVVILSILRLAVPITAVTANQVQNWLDNDREQAVSTLNMTQQEIQSLQQDNVETDRKWYQGMRDSFDIRGKLQAVESKAEQGVEAAIYLLAEFILVMVLMPVLFLYLGWQLFRKISNW